MIRACMLCVLFFLVSCAQPNYNNRYNADGTPITNAQGVQKAYTNVGGSMSRFTVKYNGEVRSLSDFDLNSKCDYALLYLNSPTGFERYSLPEYYEMEARKKYLESKGLYYCVSSHAFVKDRVFKVKEYYVNELVIKHLTKSDERCVTGFNSVLVIDGIIDADTSHIVQKLLDEIVPCANIDGEVLDAPVISMKSNGGELDHGYALGRIFRAYGVTAYVEDGATCASSCAIAFLGGRKRVLEDQSKIIFHSPYIVELNEEGKPFPNCLGSQDFFDVLKNYYVEMIGTENGDIILDRTLKYCSFEDGWEILGKNSASLYGIATNDNLFAF